MMQSTESGEHCEVCRNEASDIKKQKITAMYRNREGDASSLLAIFEPTIFGPTRASSQVL